MSIYDHFRNEELPFVERALEMLRQVELKHTMRLTDFMDPRQLAIFRSLASQVTDVTVSGWGGYEGAERCRVLLHPSYITPEEEDFKLQLVEIRGDQRFHTLQHRDVLGALLSIGLKREKFGDILLDGQSCQTVVASELFDFIRLQVKQIHRIPVELEAVPWSQLKLGTQEWTEKTVTVASPRIDALIGEVFRLSRAKALIPIRAGKVKVNWKVEDDPSARIEAGTVVSMAGFGRFQVLEMTENTKSGRIRVRVGIYQ